MLPRSGFQHLVTGEIINIFDVAWHQPRCACRRRGGVAQIVDHVLSDATDDQVQELAAVEAAATAGDI